MPKKVNTYSEQPGQKLEQLLILPNLTLHTTRYKRPMTMGTRCCKVFFPNYSKKKSAEDTLIPPQWGKRDFRFVLFL